MRSREHASLVLSEKIKRTDPLIKSAIAAINKRLERTNKEMKFKDKFDTFMINDDLSNAIKKLNEIISNQNQGVIHGS